MATSRLTHDQREQEVLSDLEASFPNFTGKPRFWTKVPDSDDPPDFISDDGNNRTGLELVEWLSGSQMGAAKGRESQRDHIRAVVAKNWEAEYQPKNFSLASIAPKWGLRIQRL